MKYAAAVIGIIVVALLAIFLIVNRGSNDTRPQTKGPAQLAKYASEDSSVSITTQGRIVGNDNFRSIRITVTPTERRLDILNSYDDTIQDSKTFPNTLSGYDTFLNALDRAGFRKKRAATVTDYKGVCPLGNRYLYNLSTSDGELINTWSDSCTASDGTFSGNAPLIRQLFQNQITDYTKLVNGVRL